MKGCPIRFRIGLPKSGSSGRAVSSSLPSTLWRTAAACPLLFAGSPYGWRWRTRSRWCWWHWHRCRCQLRVGDKGSALVPPSWRSCRRFRLSCSLPRTPSSMPRGTSLLQLVHQASGELICSLTLPHIVPSRAMGAPRGSGQSAARWPRFGQWKHGRGCIVRWQGLHVLMSRPRSRPASSSRFAPAAQYVSMIKVDEAFPGASPEATVPVRWRALVEGLILLLECLDDTYIHRRG